MNNNYYTYPYGNNALQNNFIGVYVNDYNSVISQSCPMDGSALVCIDLNNNAVYTKKLISGTPTIAQYKLVPIFNEAVKPVEQPKQEDSLKSIIDEIKSLRNEINNIKGGSINESK